MTTSLIIDDYYFPVSSSDGSYSYSSMSSSFEHLRKHNRVRHWCFTSYQRAIAFEFDPKDVRYIIYQKEVCPKTQRVHWQGYVEFFNPKRIGQVQTCLGDEKMHCVVRKGTRAQARDYCRKKATAVDGFQFEFGEWRDNVNKKRKLDELLKEEFTIDDLILHDPMTYVRYYRGLHKLVNHRQAKKAKIFRQVKVIVLVGPTGSGKTRYAIADGPNYFMKPSGDGFWFDGLKSSDTTLIIDDFYGGIKYGTFLRLLDGHPMQVPVKGNFVHAMWTKVFITSNVMPGDWYKKGLTPALDRRITQVVQFPIVPVPIIVANAPIFVDLT